MESKAKQQMRVFLSSTFVDMQEERDYLVKKIFPSIKAECRRRGVDFVALDLRWGINEETARSGKVVEICMDEIVRSRPFFIGLIGGRYGWIPKEDDEAITEKLLMKYPWVKDCVSERLSITEMEMQFGVLNNPEPINAYFFQKDEIAVPRRFRDRRGSEAAEKLAHLKSAVRTAADEGRCTLNTYSSMKALGRQVHEALMRKIDELYPEETSSRYAMYSRRQHEFIQSRRNIYVRYGEAPDLCGNVLVVGPGGIGKSALVANCAEKALEEGGYLVYTVVNNDVNTAEMCRRMLLYELSLQHPGIDAGVLDQPVNVSVDVAEALKGAGFDGKILWVIDGVDKLSLSEDRSCVWLEDQTDVILTASDTSCINPGILSRFRKEEVSELIPGEIIEITKTYLKGFAKALSGVHESHISNSPLLKNPETLRVFLEELLQFGVHEKLGGFIEGYLSQDTVVGFYSKVLERFDRDFGAKRMRTLFGALMMCAYGIPEEALVRMLKVNNVEWVAIYTAILPFISVSGGYMILDDANMSSAAESHYDIPSMRKQKSMVGRLAKIFIKEDRKLKKAADRRILEQDGRFVWFLTRLLYALSSIYRYSHPAYTDSESDRNAKDASTLFYLYLNAGMSGKAMRLAERGALYKLMSFGGASAGGIKTLLEDKRNHVADFLRPADVLFTFFDEEMSLAVYYTVLFNFIEDPQRRKDEKDRFLRKVRRMIMPESERSMVLSALAENKESVSLEALLDRGSFGMNSIMDISRRILDVFLITSDDRVKRIAEKALKTAERLDGDDPVRVMCCLIAAGAYARLGHPDADKYVAMSVDDTLTMDNLRVFYDTYDIFKAVKGGSFKDLETIADRTASYKDTRVFGYEAVYYRVRFAMSSDVEDDDQRLLEDGFAEAVRRISDLPVSFENEGYMMYNMGLYSKAQRLFERAVEECGGLIHEDQVRMLRYAGLSARKQRKTDEAASLFKKALDISDDRYLCDDLEDLYREEGRPREALFWARESLGHLKNDPDADPVSLAGAYNCLGIDATSAMRNEDIPVEERTEYFLEGYDALKEAERLLGDSESRIVVANRASLVFDAVSIIGGPARRHLDEHVRILEKLLKIPDDAGHRRRHILSTLAKGYDAQENWNGLRILRDEYGLDDEVTRAAVFRILYHCSEDKDAALSEIADRLAKDMFYGKEVIPDRRRKIFIYAPSRCREIMALGIVDEVAAQLKMMAEAGTADSVIYAFALHALDIQVGVRGMAGLGLRMACSIMTDCPEAFRHYDRLRFMMPLTEMLLENGWTQEKLDLMTARKEVDSVCREGNIAEVSNAVAAVMRTDAVVGLMSELIRGVLDADVIGGLWACLNNIGSRLDAFVDILNNAYASGSDAGRDEADKFLELVSELLDSCVCAMLNSFREGMTELNDDRIDAMMEVMDRLRLPVDPVAVWLKMLTVNSDPDSIMKLWEDYPECHVNAPCQAEYVKALRLNSRYEEAESLAVSYMKNIETDLARAPLAWQLMLVMRNTGRYDEGLALLERYENVGGGWDFSWLKALFLAYTGRPADALLLLEKTWSGSDSDCFTKAVFLLRQGLLKDAQKAAAGCGPVDKDNPDFIYVLYLIEQARYWKNAGDLAQAKENYVRARTYMDKVHMGMCEYEASRLGLEI